MPFLPSLDRLFRKHRLMQKPQIPRIIRAIKMKMATTPHAGMPVLLPMKPAASNDLSVIFLMVDSVGAAEAVSSSAVKQKFKFDLMF